MTESDIKGRLDLQEIFVKCIQTLHFGDDVDSAINNLLEVMGDYYDANRAYIFEISPDGLTNSNTYEWCREGVHPEIDNLQNLSNADMKDWFEWLKTRQVIYISNLNNDLDKDSFEYQTLAAQGINNLLVYPLYIGDRMMGYLGVDDPRKHIDDTTLFEWMAAFIVNDLEKKKRKDEKLLLSLANLCLAVYSLNLKTNTFRGLVSNDDLNMRLKEGFSFGTVNSIREKLISLVVPDMQQEARDFGDFSTINERFKSRRVLSHEFAIVSGRWVRTSYSIINRDEHGNPADLLYVIQDITEDKQKESALTYRAEHDSLTGALNHRGFLRESEVIQKLGKPVAFMMIDVDNFKEINDKYGHRAGDDVLICLTKNLRRVNGRNNYVLRLGGDEFSIILMDFDPSNTQSVVDDFNRINDFMSNPKDGLPPVTVSAGLAYDGTCDVTRLYQIADSALYQSKKSRPFLTMNVKKN